MSAKWIGYFFDDTDLEGSELLLALAIADHADADGICYPSIRKLAKKIRLGDRQTRVLLKRLEDKKVVVIERGTGRGHTSFFQLQRVQSATPFGEVERVHSGAIKGAVPRQERVHSGALPSYKEEPFKEPLIEPCVNAHETETEKVGFPVDEIFEAFPDAKDFFTPSKCALLQTSISDRTALAATIEIYRGNYDRSRNQYLPEKTGNFISVYKSQMERIAKNGNKPEPGGFTWKI